MEDNAQQEQIASRKSGVVHQTRIPPWKRWLDLTSVILTLPIWLPLMCIVCVLIRIVSRGPVIFRQERIGFGGTPFMLIKFRSMKVNTETHCHEEYLDRLIKTDVPMEKLDSTGDSRLIPLGKLFRATAMDELPQLLNVVRGEMSLVGPRPCTSHEFERYQPWQKAERIKLLPGLTGNWQVNGKNKTTFSEMIALDLDYGVKLSIWRDLTIMAKTIPVILAQICESCAKKRNLSKSKFRDAESSGSNGEKENLINV